MSHPKKDLKKGTEINILKQAGLNDEAIARMRAPIGLDIGAHTPEEIALAVLAEIVGVRNTRTIDDRR